MTKNNPLQGVMPMQKYNLKTYPLKDWVINKLSRQGYIKKTFSKQGPKRIWYFYLTYRGEKAQENGILQGWEDNQEEVKKQEIDGLDATRILYGK